MPIINTLNTPIKNSVLCIFFYSVFRAVTAIPQLKNQNIQFIPLWIDFRM